MSVRAAAVVAFWAGAMWGLVAWAAYAFLLTSHGVWTLAAVIMPLQVVFHAASIWFARRWVVR